MYIWNNNHWRHIGIASNRLDVLTINKSTEPNAQIIVIANNNGCKAITTIKGFISNTRHTIRDSDRCKTSAT